MKGCLFLGASELVVQSSVRGETTATRWSLATWLQDVTPLWPPPERPEEVLSPKVRQKFMDDSHLDQIRSKKHLWTGQLARQLPSPQPIHLASLFFPVTKPIPHWHQLWWSCSYLIFSCWEPQREVPWGDWASHTHEKAGKKDARGGTKHGNVKIWSTLEVQQCDQHMGTGRVSYKQKIVCSMRNKYILLNPMPVSSTALSYLTGVSGARLLSQVT